MNIKPKKSLGQNFLTSEKAVLEIVASGEINNGETVLEIGPGKGVLTEKLLQAGAKVIAIEKDDELFDILNEKFASEIAVGNFTLYNEDILNWNENLITTPYKLIANIPYNITGAIIRKFLTSNNAPTLMTLLIQEEVATRIIARDGKESILSISVKLYGDAKIVYRVNRGSFYPIPNVDSAVIQIKNIKKPGIDEEKFFTLLHAGFSHKRKLLLNNLSSIHEKSVLALAFNNLNLNLNIRAEDLSVADWVKLFKTIND